MKVKLGKKAPVMWFLGEPNNIIVSLNIINPGPVEFNASKLNINMKKKVLISLYKQEIEISGKTYHELYHEWITIPEEKKATEALIKEENDKFTQEQMAQQIKDRIQRLENKKLKEEAKKKEEEERMLRIAEFICGLSFRALMNRVNEEYGGENTIFMQHILNIEKKNRNRKGVVKYLTKKIQDVLIAKQRRIDRAIAKAIEEQETTDMIKGLKVIDKEEYTVFLNSNEMVEHIGRKHKDT